MPRHDDEKLEIGHGFNHLAIKMCPAFNIFEQNLSMIEILNAKKKKSANSANTLLSQFSKVRFT